MSLPSYPHFTLVEAGPGVYAALAGDTGACISNAAIIDLGDKTLIFDTFQTVTAAGDLRDAATRLTGRSAALSVISHWHPDHTGGAQVFDDKDCFAVGKRNQVVARKIFWKNNIMIEQEDVGGRTSRTLYLEIGTGRTWMTVQGQEVEL